MSRRVLADRARPRIGAFVGVGLALMTPGAIDSRAGATQTITISGDLPDGGDCLALGSWDPAINRCDVSGLSLAPGTQLSIENAILRACDLDSRQATIDNAGTLDIYGRFVNTGTITNRAGATLWIDDGSSPNWNCPPGPKDNSGTIDTDGDVIFFDSLDNGPEGSIRGAGGVLISPGTVRNSGTITIDGVWANDGALENAVDGTLTVSGPGTIWGEVGSVLTNHGRLDNHGRIEGFTAWTLNNRGVLNNHATLSTCWDVGLNGTLDNEGLINNFSQLFVCGTLDNLAMINNAGEVRAGFSDPGATVQNSGSIVDCGTLAVTVAGAPATTSADGDADGHCDALDCAASDPSVWDPPGEARLLHLSHGIVTPGETRLEWVVPLYPGASAVQHDVLSSLNAADFLVGPLATCVESADGSDLSAVDVIDPASGEVVFFLVRALNPCGQGSPGSASDGTPRLVRDCP